MKALLLFISLSEIVLLSYSQPALQWQKSVGGSGAEYANHILQLPDGGYFSAGYSESNDGDFLSNHGNSDFAVARISSTGQVLWTKLYGGTEDEEIQSFVRTLDGGYVLAGYTNSYDGDVTGNHGSYAYDFWVVKIDSSGNIIWKYAYGGSSDDKANSISLCTDGGFIISGSSDSDNGDVTGNHGMTDYWLIRLNSAGQLQWQKSLGGADYEEAYSAIQTLDGGFIVCGRSSSTDGDITGNHGGADSWIAKLDNSGTLQWQKSYGGTETEEANSIIQLSDGNYVFFGYSCSNNGDVSGQHNPGSGNDDFWAVKINGTGTILWQKCLGGSLSEQGEKIIETADGGFLLSGLVTSSDGDVSGIHSGFYSPDFWLVKINSGGSLVWQKCLGGSDQDEAHSAALTSDGGCILSGFSYSTDGDVTGHHSQTDWWIVKLGSFSGIEMMTINDPINMYPNPCIDKLFFEIKGADEKICLTFFTIAGEQVQQSYINNESYIDVSGFLEGIYIMKIQAGSDCLYKKVIVSK